MQSEASSHEFPSAKSGRHVPPSQCALPSQSASLTQPVLQVGTWSDVPTQVTLGKKPHVLAVVRLPQPVSSATPVCVPHWKDALHVASERVPWQVAAVLQVEGAA
mgnify:CR=1 FL=1